MKKRNPFGVRCQPATLTILGLLIFSSIALHTVHACVSGFDPGRAPFALRLKGLENPFRVQFTTVMPGDTLAIEAVVRVGTSPPGALTARATGGRIERLDADRWRFIAPHEPGQYSIDIAADDAKRSIALTVFVLKPYSRSLSLDGYEIGKYADPPAGDREAYAAPRGFIEVTPENAATLVAPHFRLEQFLCKQAASFPKYLMLNERLLIKLEAILERLNRRGIAAHTLQVMSGFRTPFYNRAIGNRTSLSRHHYGDAADIFVDEDGNGKMDDLNGDHACDDRDAAFLREIAAEIDLTTNRSALIGGLSLYGETAHRGSMVHVDTRGRPARW